MDNIPSEVAVFPRMSSPFTRINYGMCATSEWHNVFGLVENGKKAVFRTNRMIEPWIQLDLLSELFVLEVVFESGLIASDASQSCEVFQNIRMKESFMKSICYLNT